MTSRLLAALLLLLVAHGCGDDDAPDPPTPDAGPYEPEPFTATDATRAYCRDADGDAVEARITELLREMTLEDKVAMLSGAALAPQSGVWLVRGDEAHGLPGLHMLDGPRGVSRLAEQTATAFPVGMARGATWDPELEARVGAAMGVEIRSVGADVLLAPTMNILRHPRWGRAQETYGEDTHHMGVMALAFVEGAQEHVLATAKHYAANSIDDTRFRVDVSIDERTLREIYLPHFGRVVREGRVGAVMSAYNLVNGAYCAENPHLLSDILKGEWEFAGPVMSDWAFGTRSTVPSITAGLDIEMPFGVFYGAELVAAVERDEIPHALVDRAFRRVARAQLCFGLDTDPPVRDPSMRETPEHVALALEAARRSLVLLKNEGVLPIDRAAVTRVAVAGPLADLENIGDLGSSAVTPSSVVTALEGITDRAGGAVEVVHVPGEALDPAGEAAITAADVAVVIAGLTSEDEGEGAIASGDRESLALAPAQVALIRAVAALAAQTVVVLEGGASIVVADWVGDVDALLMAWYPGQEGGLAIGDVLFGDVNPSGRLPVSFPVAESDLPPFDNVSDAVIYDYWHGYRHLERTGTTPQYAFGFGLGYTTFELSALALDRTAAAGGDVVTASVDVRNAGAVTGTETVQLYVSYPGSAVERAPHDLRGFAQVTLMPGETQTVEIPLRVDDLRHWDTAADGWALEALDYRVHVGSSSLDLPLDAMLTVPGG